MMYSIECYYLYIAFDILFQTALVDMILICLICVWLLMKSIRIIYIFYDGLWGESLAD